jgi:hypothetical protein
LSRFDETCCCYLRWTDAVFVARDGMGQGRWDREISLLHADVLIWSGFADS